MWGGREREKIRGRKIGKGPAHGQGPERRCGEKIKERRQRDKGRGSAVCGRLQKCGEKAIGVELLGFSVVKVNHALLVGQVDVRDIAAHGLACFHPRPRHPKPNGRCHPRRRSKRLSQGRGKFGEGAISGILRVMTVVGSCKRGVPPAPPTHPPFFRLRRAFFFDGIFGCRMCTVEGEEERRAGGRRKKKTPAAKTGCGVSPQRPRLPQYMPRGKEPFFPAGVFFRRDFRV